MDLSRLMQTAIEDNDNKREKVNIFVFLGIEPKFISLRIKDIPLLLLFVFYYKDIKSLKKKYKKEKK